MANYKLEVTTGKLQDSGTFDHIYVTLTGTRGQSERTELDNYGLDFKRGMTGVYSVKTKESLGKLLLITVEKEPIFLRPTDEWYCSKIVVTTPEGDAILFPCYRWVSNKETVELRGGKAIKLYEEEHPLLIKLREKELEMKRGLYRWGSFNEKLPHTSDFKSINELPREDVFSVSKNMEMLFNKATIGAEFKCKNMVESTERWKKFEDIEHVYWFKRTPLSDYVAEHWKEDDFFGAQFLNGVNPNMIKRCSELPKNFPVKEEMVKPFLKQGSSLKEEMENGNIFIYDQKKMDGIPAREYNGQPLGVTPGLCLFYLNPENKMMPIAIQLQQHPSERNPIFLPSDSETDWLLAKMFIKNADAMDHQSAHHLMNTHFLAEGFALSTLRCLPEIHPLHKMLISHFRYTIRINTGGLKALFGDGGLLSVSSLGYNGIVELMGRTFSEVTYRSLCPPDDIIDRGLEFVPSFYYRDDSFKLWNVINRFVKGMVEHFYPTDSDVRRDTELQDWIKEIFTYSFLGKKASGIPQCFDNVQEVIKFITMVIFMVTGQHAAVNNGQFDHCSLVLNSSLLLRKPPPTTKGQTTTTTVFETIPNVGETVKFAGMAFVLSDKYLDEVLLGEYPDERFDEAVPKQKIKEFQADLLRLSKEITQRNSKLEWPYTYLDPALVENSIAI